MNQPRLNMPLESSIVARVRNALNAQYGPSAKFMKTSGDGEPDLVGSINGASYVIECKQYGKKPTILQYARLREWARSGAVALWFNGEKCYQIDASGNETYNTHFYGMFSRG